jgi:hypothetical protein
MAVDTAPRVMRMQATDTTGVISLANPVLVPAVWAISAFVIAGGIGREVAAAMTGTPSATFGHNTFMLDGEANLPTAISALFMVFAALLLFINARLPAVATSVDRGRWLLLSVGFLFLAADEVAQFHELLKAPLRNMATFTDWLAFPWVIVALPVVLVVAIYFLPFLARLPAATRIGFTVSGLIYIGGAIGMEMASARLATYTGWGSGYYVVAAAIEETMEIVGLALFVTVLLRLMRSVRITVGMRQSHPSPP